MFRLILLLCLCGVAAPAWSLRCGSDIVSVGDPSLLLRKRCGPPTQIDHQESRSPIRRYDPYTRTYVLDYQSEPYDIWTYNFGPNRLITRITIKAGIIRSITTDGYGY